MPVMSTATSLSVLLAPSHIVFCCQNLKYLGLMGLWSLMKSHPRVVAGEHTRSSRLPVLLNARFRILFADALLS